MLTRGSGAAECSGKGWLSFTNARILSFLGVSWFPLCHSTPGVE